MTARRIAGILCIIIIAAWLALIALAFAAAASLTQRFGFPWWLAPLACMAIVAAPHLIDAVNINRRQK